MVQDLLSKHLIESVKLHEGLRLKTYLDTENIPTIGYGTNLEEVGLHKSYANTLEITQETAQQWLEIALLSARDDARSFRWFGRLDRVRQEAIIEMVYNLGAPRLSKFRKMIAAIEREDWNTAYDEALDSKWHRQVGARSVRIACQLRTGKYWND